jgi:hypothetical protein
MGKGGSPQPTQTTAYQTNLPEYAKPYVENMLNAAQKQVYSDDMKSFRPYTPYSSDPSQYFAGPSNLQRSTYGEAAGMQTPGQYGMATGLGGLAGIGQMGAGQRFAQQATDPFAVQQYMSPFMQNVVDTQKLSALRDFQVAQPTRQAQATLRGAFGGSRSAIENAEAQRNLMSQLQSIQATGTQKAFEDAQKQQQFGANLGLQGLAGASQTAGMLGQLGGSQQQADLARMGFQNQLGTQQQQFQQGIINQAVQDYATKQQYPMLQLANISNLLRGLPMQAATTQTYQAAPSTISQLGGLGATALGAYGASGGFRAAQGGEVKSYAEGGEVASYAPGGVVGGVEAQLMQMEIPQLQQVAKTSPSASIREKAAEIIAQKQMAMQSKKAMGIDTLPAGNLDDIGMAGGGIVAFQNRGLVEDPLMAFSGLTPEALAEDEIRRQRLLQQRAPAVVRAAAPTASVTPAPAVAAASVPVEGKYESEIQGLMADLKKGLGEGRAQKDLDTLREEMRGSKDQNLWLSLIKGGAKAMAGKSQYALSNIGEGIAEGVGAYGKGLEGERADKKLLLAQQSALEQAEYARKTGNLNALIAAQTRIDTLKSQRENLAANKELAILSARDKAYGDLVGRLYVQTQDIDQAKAMADKIYSSSNLGGMPGGSKLPEGIKVTKVGK